DWSFIFSVVSALSASLCAMTVVISHTGTQLITAGAATLHAEGFTPISSLLLLSALSPPSTTHTHTHTHTHPCPHPLEAPCIVYFLSSLRENSTRSHETACAFRVIYTQRLFVF